MKTIKLMILLFSVLAFFGLAKNSRAAVIPATSCNQPDVQQVLDQAQDGDIVQIPAGTCEWTQGISVGNFTAWNPPVFNTKAITIQGAGKDQTIIVNKNFVDANGRGGGLIGYATKLGGITRITGMTLDSSDPNLDPYGYNRATIGIQGYSQSFRIDNIHFKIASGNAITFDGDHFFGVVDHNTFDIIGHHGAFYLYQQYWNGKTDGSGSWTDPVYWGTEKAVYIEDNVFNHDPASGGSPWVLDGWNGARAVLRYNTLNDISIGGYHGTDTSFRSARSAEIYNNTITIAPNNVRDIGKAQLRGGSFLVFNNNETDPQAVPGAFGAGVWFVTNYRDFEPFGASWGKCDGSSPWDLNDNITYETGTHSGTSGSRVLTVSGKNWTTDQWAGYYVHDITKDQQNPSWPYYSALIVSNTADTITTTTHAINRNGDNLTWNNGDSFQILRPQACMDNRGRGKGDLILNNPPNYIPVNATTGTATWPHQELEPSYGWNNTLNGAPDKIYLENPWTEKEGRDFYNSPLPGYTPYIYPHPLTLGGGNIDTTAPSAPQGLTVQ